MISFDNPQMFWLLILPLLVFILFPLKNGQHGDAIRVPFLEDIKQIKKSLGFFNFSSNGRFLFSLKLFYLSLLWILLVIAAARPQYIGEPYRIKNENRDIMLVVDISQSMLQPDFSINNKRLDRLSAVKMVVGNFIENRANDRLGLILFGTLAYLQSPLTFDKTTVRNILMNADAGMAGNSTSIGDALGLALKNLKTKENKENSVIVLLTDGENNDGSLSMAQAISLAEKEGIKIYTVGVGSDASFIGSLFGIKDNELDEKSLKALAQRTNGNYFRATNLASLTEIYNKIDKLEPQNDESNVIQEKEELFYIPLLIALVLVCFLLFIPRSFYR